MNNVWVVVPAFNEAGIIRRVVDDLVRVIPHVVVVNDASTDETSDKLLGSEVVVLQHLINRGQGAALKTGIVYALRQGAEVIVTFDADGQHDVADISSMISPILEGSADVTLGSRFLRDGSNVPPLRRIVLFLGILFTRFFSHIRVTDTHNGFRAMNRLAAEKIQIIQDRMSHASEILDEIMRHKLRYQEVPVTVTYSYYSKEKGQGNLAMIKIALKFLIYKLRS